MQYLVFDIETGHKPLSVIEDLWGPIEDPPFDPSEVKLGNIKDPAKAEAKIAAAEKKHAMGASQRVAKAQEELLDKALLRPEACRIVTIARKMGGEYKIPDGSEAEMLEGFWETVKWHRDRGNRIIGFNIKDFDLPILIVKSWELGVKVPTALIDKDRFWNSIFVDLLEKWRLGRYRSYIKLEVLAKSMGFGCGKPMSGKDFHKVWDTDRDAAIEYAKSDLDMTEFVARKMGVVS